MLGPTVVLNATLVAPRTTTGELRTTVVLNATLVAPGAFGPVRRGRRDNRKSAIMPSMATSRVRLPRGVRPPYSVFVNGVRQEEGKDYRVERGVLVFEADLAKEGKLGFWRWFWGAWGIGTYRKDDKVDVAWEVDGQPRVAHALEIERVE